MSCTYLKKGQISKKFYAASCFALLPQHFHRSGILLSWFNCDFADGAFRMSTESRLVHLSTLHVCAEAAVHDGHCAVGGRLCVLHDPGLRHAAIFARGGLQVSRCQTGCCAHSLDQLACQFDSREWKVRRGYYPHCTSGGGGD